MPVIFSPSASTPRLIAIQALRGIATIMVVAAHAFGSARHASGVAHSVIDAIAPMGAAGVDLFFVISGFVMALTIDAQPRAVATFARDRFVRIVPLFWVLSALYVAAGLAGSGAWGLGEIVNNMTIIPLFDGAHYRQLWLFVGWTLSFELSFYALVALALVPWRAPVDRVQRLIMLTGAAALAGLVWQPQWAPARIVFNPMMLEFLFGIAIYRIWRRGDWAHRAPWLMMAGIVLIAVVVKNPLALDISLNAAAVTDNGEGLARALVLGVPFALIFAGVVLDRSPAGVGQRLMGQLGNASYSIYLTQVFVLDVVNRAADHGVVSDYATIATLILGGSVIAGLSVHHLIERPLLGWFKPARPRADAATQPAVYQ